MCWPTPRHITTSVWPVCPPELKVRTPAHANTQADVLSLSPGWSSRHGCEKVRAGAVRGGVAVPEGQDASDKHAGEETDSR